MMHLKVSTSVDVGIGPFLDETDGKTAETALTITQPDVRLKKNGGAWAQKAAAQTLTHEENGWYEVTLDATDTDTIGHLLVAIHESGALPVWREFHVLAANVYDSLYGAATDKLDVNVEEWNTTAVPAEHTAGYPIVTVKDGAGTGEINTNAGKVVGVELTDTLTTYTGNTVQTGDAFARLGAPAGASVSADILVIDNLVDDLESRVGTPSNLGGGATVAANLSDIEAQTDDIGAAGAGLTSIPDSAGVTSLLSRIPAALFSGITSLAQWLGLMAGKQSGNATARTEIRATGAGSGAYDETTDSLEAVRDKETDIETDTQDLQNRTPAALVGGRMDANVGAISSDATAADNAEAFFDGTGYAGTGNVIPSVTTVTGNVNGSVGSVTGAVGSVTGAVGGNVTGSVGSLAAQAKADVNAEVLDVLNVDTFAEPTSAPAATSTLRAKIGWIFKMMRNKRTQTSTTETLFADDGTTSDSTSAKTDSSGTFTRGEWS